ncbi:MULTISPECIES: hypothetical protein [unclassified Polaromonas]|jgi:hypothetical protein|uniref:hypothetical protein n=1 Tax=unclassified Polaromonas TaxID=2638319 RepID=UPI000BCE4706|nr:MULTISPECIES: hypothetical protein [unclassified Polaromonas]OYY34741.1 MAG: hypothetical protein B7Y60_14970 [Polaromonas sp. 35-63-35]OYZ19374.1 MAG: hypothetical protein B7Y28_12620 [Polaromonas sp. 16-63-31]OYZ77501.1 MAG: hypothetical protein B7Y09_16120 [Polaromonas sp. 24-63-21]OZA48515.1 MAG: hypothetical protein B7X88_18390 [Polaromonas sp. 17-63-33]OZA87265.1 MAG: hypothetical protein B7X65_13870 [Polaromonas sp. 39-63-25]
MQIFITLGDIVGIAAGGLVGLALAAVWAIDSWRKYRCKHVEYFENRACSAICRSCGKDLGFIQTVRDARRAAPTGQDQGAETP